MKILHNHLGYLLNARKVALIQHEGVTGTLGFTVFDAKTRAPVLRSELSEAKTSWPDRHYLVADFSALCTEGIYFLALDGIRAPLVSAEFQISATLYDTQLVSNLVHYFKSQRCTGIFDKADSNCPKFGSDERVDVHGGWYDASGDASKYLSHMSYTNYMNPQQIPQVVWNLIDGRARMPAQSVWLDERMVDEALHGAEFLVRMQDKAGYFYMTVFDRWSKDVRQREICSYTTQQGHKFDTYQAGYRQGGGSAIAALARASALPRDGEYPRNTYLHVAQTGFAHLEQHNLSYLDDGVENIIDDYCALLAAVELFAATGQDEYAAAAEKRAGRLILRQHADGWFWADDGKTRSYFHAAEAGLPLLALMRFIEVVPHSPLAGAARTAVLLCLKHEIGITLKSDANPFSYPRQYVQMPGKAGRTQFFIPHDNESGYWWQGENARLGSLCSAALCASGLVEIDASMKEQLNDYALACLNWIFGFNPFDVCMMQGHGRNNPRYEPGFRNAPGGVCNGITSGLEDEDDIDFKNPADTVPTQSWRWTEQWIPHGAWLFHALSRLQNN